MLSWRRKVLNWLSSHDPNTQALRGTITWLSRLERRVDDMAELMDALKAEVAKLKDAVAANESNVEQLRKAYEWLRDHPKVKEDPELAAVATQIGDLTKDIAATVAKAGASGG